MLYAPRGARFFVLAALLFFIFSDNPLIRALSLPVIALFCLFSAVFFLTKKRSIQINPPFWVYCLYAFFVVTLTGTSFYNYTFTPLVFGCLAILYSAVIFSLPKEIVKGLIEVSSTVLIITCIFTIPAIIVSFYGYPSWTTFGVLEFYPFSFMYPTENKLMRVAGFMYEPGQLSFYLCYVVACREFLGMKRSTSIWLIILGITTQSLSHILFLLGFIIYLSIVKGRRFNKTLILTSSITALFLTYAVGYLSWMIDRAILFYESPDVWGRFISFSYALGVLDGSWEKVLFGPSADLAARILSASEQFSLEFSGVSIYGENPLSPLIFGGLLASWPYYLFLIFTVWLAIYKGAAGFLLLLCALLTLQRPYTLEFPYTLIISLTICCYFLSRHTTISAPSPVKMVSQLERPF